MILRNAPIFENKKVLNLRTGEVINNQEITTPVDKDPILNLRTSCGLPKIISTEFVYCLTIKLSFYNLVNLLDDKNVIDYEEDYSYNRDHLLVKEVYITFKEKPDIEEFQENIKSILKENRLVHEVWTIMKFQEEIIVREGEE